MSGINLDLGKYFGIAAGGFFRLDALTLRSLNFGVHTAWRKARDRDIWHQVVSMAVLHCGVLQ